MTGVQTCALPICFTETQLEEVTPCERCGGALRIDSTTDRGAHILAVHIPHRACPACRDRGLAWFDEASPKRFDRIVLQDGPADRYAVKAREAAGGAKGPSTHG